MSLPAYHVRSCAHDKQVGWRHRPPVEFPPPPAKLSFFSPAMQRIEL
jgi:hypothetical protein